MADRKKRSKTSIPKDESKAARFIRVCKPRVTKACKAIKVIGYCAGSPYEYTPKQLAQITDALDAAQNEMLAKFAGKKGEVETFAFKE